MRTVKELAAQAALLWADIGDSFQVDMDKFKAGDEAERLRIGEIHALFDGVFCELTKRVFDYARVEAGTYRK